MSYQEFRVAYELTSAILCFILVRFMIKPYRLTGEGRYLGLPLAFGLLGSSYLFSSIIYAELPFFRQDFLWFQLVARTFAFMFLAATYYFSKKSSERSRLLWNVTSSLIMVAIVTSVVAVIFMPQFNFDSYRTASQYVRIFIIICLVYVIIHVFRSHMAKPDPTTLLIPLGYVLFAISQYSLIIWAVDDSMFAFWGALGLRWGGLAIFLFVAYVTFYGSQKRANK